MRVINRSLPNQYENIELYVLGDLHLEDKLCNMRQFEKWKREVLAEPNRYVITNGDLLDNATKTSIGDSYSARLAPNEAINKLVEILEPLKNRILCMTEGNHELRTAKKEGVLITERVARELGLKELYCEGAYLIFLSIGKNRGRDDRQTVYSIYGKHGSGGGGKEGSKVQKVADMQSTIDCDLYLHSHTHMASVFKTNYFRSDYRHKMAIEIPHTFVNTNAFLGHGGYGESFGFKPANLDYPKIILNGTEKDIKVLL